jgi:hypothetical protein
MKETVVTLACALIARLAMAVDTMLTVRRSFFLSWSFLFATVRESRFLFRARRYILSLLRLPFRHIVRADRATDRRCSGELKRL